MIDWRIRPYREGDAADMAANWTKCFAADGLDIVVSEQEIIETVEKPGFDATRQVLIVEGPPVEGLPDKLIPGWCWLDIRNENDERIYGPRVSVHPAAQPLGLERLLALRLIDMAKANEADHATPRVERVRLRESFSDKQESQRMLYTKMGLRQTRIFWTMECSLDALPESGEVAGVKLRPFRRPQDNLATLDALNNSFIDHFDFHPPSPERWEHRINSHTFRPDLSWVAIPASDEGQRTKEQDVHLEQPESQKFVGFCLCGVIDEENRVTGRLEGWIETLGTVRGWRGLGLGRALLLNGLHSLRDAGLEIGMLGVDSTNPTGATRLYESVGFTVRDTWLNYECPFDEVLLPEY